MKSIPKCYKCNKCIKIAQRNNPQYAYRPLFPDSSDPEEIADIIKNMEESNILFLEINELKKTQ